jgi:glycosyltransferase involved in cell wall biosynthesis
VSVIRNGLGTESFARATRFEVGRFRARLGLADGAVLVGGVMRLSAEKRPLLWLEAAAALARRRKDVRFAIAGDGPMAEACRSAVARLGLAPRLTFLGEMARPELLMTSMDLMLLTSAFEGTPNVLLEAQWLGKPVLSTEAGGALETFEPGVTGQAAMVAEPEAIAGQMVGMIDDPRWRETAARRGPEFVEARFGLARMIAETLAAYGLAP